MAQVVNAGQAEAWNGYEGTHWAGHQARYDAVNEAFNEPLLAAAAIAPGERVLDVGCGNGQTTRLAAAQARPGRATGFDLSGPMLERARRSAAEAGLDNAEFVQADVQAHAFPAGGYDVALSRFGVMFFADPIAAFGNLARALRPGGRLAFVSLRSLAESDLGPVLAALGGPGPVTGHGGPSAPGPESLADPEAVCKILTEAGFTGVETTPVDAPQYWGRDAQDAAEFLAGWGPVRHRLADADRARTAEAVRALTEAFRPHQGPDGVRLRGAALLVRAGRPLSPR